MPAIQQELSFDRPAMTREELAAYLDAGIDGPVHVTITRNRASMASVQSDARGIRVRLHHEFLSAPKGVLRQLRTFLRTRRGSAWAAVRAFAMRITPDGRSHVEPRALRSRGAAYDLNTVADEVNHTFFGGRVSCRIGWGTRRPRPRRRSIRYGSWNAATRSIKVNPLLDTPRVPAEFVRYIVFHEMLHAVVPSVHRSDRRLDHPAEFRVLERRFPDLPRMRWLARELLSVLDHPPR